jgi:hypothetical protein
VLIVNEDRGQVVGSKAGVCKHNAEGSLPCAWPGCPRGAGKSIKVFTADQKSYLQMTRHRLTINETGQVIFYWDCA